MVTRQKYPGTSRLIQILSICFFVFASSPSSATYYGGHHYQHHYDYYGYPYHRPYYNYHHGHDRGYRAHYGVHAHLGGDAAYVVLGVLGAALLAHILTKDTSSSRNTSPEVYSYYPPVKVVRPAAVVYKKPVNKKTIYHYSKNEGWDWLAKGNADYALDIFAIQSQQNLNAGEPKVGFAIAAATIGEKDRAIHAMRKAVRIDANALNNIDINTIKPTVKKLTEDFQSGTNNKPEDADVAFMMASLFYLQQDYETANTLIAENDQSQSANNLRELLKSNIGKPLN